MVIVVYILIAAVLLTMYITVLRDRDTDIDLAIQREIQTQTNSQLIWYYHDSEEASKLAQTAFNEIEKRGIFPSKEKNLIVNHKIKIGMSEVGMILATKDPCKINKHVYSRGTYKRYVFQYSHLYVYIKNGKVVRWNKYQREYH